MMDPVYCDKCNELCVGLLVWCENCNARICDKCQATMPHAIYTLCLECHEEAFFALGHVNTLKEVLTIINKQGVSPEYQLGEIRGYVRTALILKGIDCETDEQGSNQAGSEGDRALLAVPVRGEERQ